MRGQSALAYLVMLAAVLTLAVTAVVIFQSMLSPAQAANLVLDDKYQASMVGIELPDYKYVYSGTTHAPETALYAGVLVQVTEYAEHPGKYGEPITRIGYNKALDVKFYIQNFGDGLLLQTLHSKLCEKFLAAYPVEANYATVDAYESAVASADSNCDLIPFGVTDTATLGEMTEQVAFGLATGGVSVDALSEEGVQAMTVSGLIANGQWAGNVVCGKNKCEIPST